MKSLVFAMIFALALSGGAFNSKCDQAPDKRQGRNFMQGLLDGIEIDAGDIVFSGCFITESTV